MRLDQLHDVQPNVGRLVGGPHDGLRVTFVREWPALWRMSPVTPWFTLDSPSFDSLAPVRCPTYQSTASVDDDGVRVYRYVGDQ
ncbi:hypothetical protein ACWEPL_12410 [Nonomuraea sp. NPDC004186]